jgi:hypothetical protein
MARGCRASFDWTAASAPLRAGLGGCPYMSFLTAGGCPYMLLRRFVLERLTGGVGWPNITAFEGLVFS